jgi:hypothetical protein
MLGRQDEQIHAIQALGLSEAELFDLTLAASLFSALAIIEPISEAVAPSACNRSIGQAGGDVDDVSSPTGLANDLP